MRDGREVRDEGDLYMGYSEKKKVLLVNISKVMDQQKL